MTQHGSRIFVRNPVVMYGQERSDALQVATLMPNVMV